VHEQELPTALAGDLDNNFARLVEIYQDRLYAFSLRLSGNPQDAEEITVDALVRAYQALTRYEGERIQALALRPWLYQITLNVFRNRVRGQRLQLVSQHLTEETAALHVADEEASRPDALLERAELRETLATLIAELPERERVAVVLRHIQGSGYNEIAGLLRQPVGTVKAHVHRGMRRLREALHTHAEWRETDAT
jgi:RNA polymerase sigma-70 factor (ECF subfamily)